jgi:hypothetical protein
MQDESRPERGRPRLSIDARQVELLASMFLSTAEIGAVLECSSDTLERNFAAALKEGRDKAGASLKRCMYQKAMTGDTTMLIWLSKNYLNMSDKGIRTPDPSRGLVNVEALEALTTEQRRRRIVELCVRLGFLQDDQAVLD